MPRPKTDGAAPSRPARTLKRLAREAEALDRHNAALKPSLVDGASDHPRLTPVIPRTIDQLRVACGAFGDAAVAEARWSAILAWFWNKAEHPATSAIADAAWDAVFAMRDYDRHRYEHPCWQGRDHSFPLPERFKASQGSTEQIERLADSVAALWERDGQPHLTADKIRAKYQHITSCEAYRDRYGQPGDDKPIDNQENAA